MFLNLYIIWLYGFEFVTCKVSVDAFSLLYYKLLQAKLGLFVFGATLLNLISNLFYITLFVTSVFRL